jgi:hypothetical protein
VGRKFKRALQPDRLLGSYAHRFLESKQGNLCLGLIIYSQRFDTIRLDARFIRIERGDRSFACTILHQSKKISINLEKLFDKPQIAYRSESLTEAHANLTAEQPLPIDHALLRGFFVVLRDLRATSTAPEEFQWERSPYVNRVVPAIHFFQSAKSQGWVLPEARLRHISFRHSDLLTFRLQGGIDSQSPSYEFFLSDSPAGIKKITGGPRVSLLR